MKKIATLLIVLGLLVALVPNVLADDDGTTEGEVVVTGTTPTILTSRVVMAPASLNVFAPNSLSQTFDQTVVQEGLNLVGDGNGNNMVWEARDTRGTGAGWSITIEATDFEEIVTTAHKIPLKLTDKHSNMDSFFMELHVADITWVDGQYDSDCTTHANCAGTSGGDLMPYTGEFDDADYGEPLTEYVDGVSTAKVVATANQYEGMGSYQFSPDFQLIVPAETYAGTYRNDLIVTMVFTP